MFVGFQLQSPKDPSPAQLGGSVLLPCYVEHPIPLEELEVEWRRTDSGALVHLFQEGEVRSDSQDYAYTGRAHLFMEEVIRGNYSLVLNNVTREDTGVYVCKVYNNSASSNITAEVYLGELKQVSVFKCWFPFHFIKLFWAASLIVGVLYHRRNYNYD